MAAKKSDPVLQELRHEPVPGFARPFLIVAAVAIVYLALILVTSPGKVKKDYGKKDATPTQSSDTTSHAQP
jgi:hypothetical protein